MLPLRSGSLLSSHGADSYSRIGSMQAPHPSGNPSFCPERRRRWRPASFTGLGVRNAGKRAKAMKSPRPARCSRLAPGRRAVELAPALLGTDPGSRRGTDPLTSGLPYWPSPTPRWPTSTSTRLLFTASGTTPSAQDRATDKAVIRARALIGPMIPPAKPGGHVRTVDIREIVNGIMCVLSTGCQWRSHRPELPVHDCSAPISPMVTMGGAIG